MEQKIYRMVKEKGHKKAEKIELEMPNVWDILGHDFNYAQFIEDWFASRKGIYQGYFEELADMDITIFYNHDVVMPVTEHSDEFSVALDKITKKYKEIMYELQYQFECGLNNGINIDELNKTISKKMTNVAFQFNDAYRIVERYFKEKPKRLEAPKEKKEDSFENEEEVFANVEVVEFDENTDWRYVPFNKHYLLNFGEDRERIENARRKIINLPNTPDNYGKYTFMELAEMNSEYINKGKTK